MTDQDHDQDTPPTEPTSERQRLLDQILDPRSRPVLLALYSRWHGDRPHHDDTAFTRGVVYSLPTFGNEHVRFTISVYNRQARKTKRRTIRVTLTLFAASVSDLDLARGDFVEVVSRSVDDTNVRDALYLRKIVDDQVTPFEQFIEIIGGLLALQPHGDEAS
jgi:hypothetical protein